MFSMSPAHTCTHTHENVRAQAYTPQRKRKPKHKHIRIWREWGREKDSVQTYVRENKLDIVCSLYISWSQWIHPTHCHMPVTSCDGREKIRGKFFDQINLTLVLWMCCHYCRHRCHRCFCAIRYRPVPINHTWVLVSPLCDRRCCFFLLLLLLTSAFLRFRMCTFDKYAFAVMCMALTTSP